jgi:hypothetical protein
MTDRKENILNPVRYENLLFEENSTISFRIFSGTPPYCVKYILKGK